MSRTAVLLCSTENIVIIWDTDQINICAWIRCEIFGSIMTRFCVKMRSNCTRTEQGLHSGCVGDIIGVTLVTETFRVTRGDMALFQTI